MPAYPAAQKAMLVPELPLDIDSLCNSMRRNIIKGKVSDIIILAEGVCDAAELKKQIEQRVPIVIRTVKLGYIQRGGTPTMADRILAARCAVKAVDLLKTSKGGRVVGIKNNKIIDMDVTEALALERVFDIELYTIANLLSQ